MLVLLQATFIHSQPDKKSHNTDRCIYNRNRSLPVFTRITGCSCHAHVPAAWCRYNRRTWWCWYAFTTWSIPEPETTTRYTTRAASPASAATADGLWRPGSTMGYKMAASTARHTTASFSWSGDDSAPTRWVHEWPRRRRQFVGLEREVDRGKRGQQFEHQRIPVPDFVMVPRRRSTLKLVSCTWDVVSK